MTEVPEHLLARSAKRRFEMTGEGADPSASSDTAPAAAAGGSSDAEPKPSTGLTPVVPSPVPEPVPEPVKPWVIASNTRQKIPAWIAPILVFLPIWFAIYWATLEPPTRDAVGPLAVGASVYLDGGCAACHGPGGGGGVGPALNGGEVLLTFPDWESQVAWVINGSPLVNGTPFGAADRPEGQRLSEGGMAPWVDALSAEELLAVTLYERVEHGGQPLEELALLEAAIDGLETGELSFTFSAGMTGDDVASVFAELDLEVEAEETAGE